MALTKVDAVDADAGGRGRAAAIRAMLAGTSLAGAPIVPVSSIDGRGLPELRPRLPTCATGRWRSSAARPATMRPSGWRSIARS